jgi:hypothetical protein
MISNVLICIRLNFKWIVVTAFKIAFNYQGEPTHGLLKSAIKPNIATETKCSIKNRHIASRLDVLSQEAHLNSKAYFALLEHLYGIQR